MGHDVKVKDTTWRATGVIKRREWEDEDFSTFFKKNLLMRVLSKYADREVYGPYFTARPYGPPGDDLLEIRLEVEDMFALKDENIYLKTRLIELLDREKEREDSMERIRREINGK